MLNKNKVFFLYVLICFLCSGLVAFAGTVKDFPASGAYKNDGLIFSVLHAEIIRQQPNVSYLAVTFDLKNETEHRKIDLNNKLELTLTDDFQNNYSQLEMPQWYAGSTEVLNDNSASLYPGKVMTQTAFFEVPINTASEIILSIDATGADIQDNIHLRFLTKNIKMFIPEQKKYIPTDDDLKIEYPKSGMINVRPGDYVHMNIKLSSDVSSPSKVYILSPNYMFEDSELKYSYNVLIPESQKSGPFNIVIMIEWNEDTGKRYISKSVIFDVVDPEI